MGKMYVATSHLYSYCLWAIFGGCFLYGAGFFLVFAVAEELWVQLVAGFLGVSAVTILPVLYGFCYRQLRGVYGAPLSVCKQAICASFAFIGTVVFFSFPVIYCLPWYGIGQFATVLLTYILLVFLLFHGALWYCFFVIYR